jgi:hypothetical protein
MGLSSLYGKTCTATLAKRTMHVVVFDWSKLKDRATFLGDIFGDCEDGDYPKLLGVSRGRTAWIGDVVPFALWNVSDDHEGGFRDGDGYPQFDKLLLIAPSGRGAVYGIDVDGTASPAKSPKKVAASLAALKLTPVVRAKAPKRSAAAPDFSERPVLTDILGGVDAGRYRAAENLIERLTGLGARRNVKPPKDRDPRWIEALREDLRTAVLRSNAMHQGGAVYTLAAALVTFGAPGREAALAVDAEVRAQNHADGIRYGLPYLREMLDQA